MGEYIKGLLKSRDEMSLRNLRFRNWNIILLFACAIIMGDLRLIDLGEDAVILGLESFTLDLMVYGVAILLFAFIPRRWILPVARIGVVLMLGSLIFELITGLTESLPLYLLYSFADGLCLGAAVYLFFFFLNNGERLFNMIVICLYYVIVVELLFDAGRFFFVSVLPFFLVGFFAVSIFTLRQDRMSVLPLPLDKEREKDPVGKLGMVAVFSIYAIYEVIDMLYIYLVYDTDSVLTYAFVAGCLLSLVLLVVITVLLSRNIWYIWILFLICALFSMGLLALSTPVTTNVGSLLYGVAYDLGYAAVIYLIGGAAALSGSMRYFRVFCVVECIIAVFMSSGLTYLFGGIESNFNLISLGIMVVLCGITMGLSPILNRRVFMTDWVSSLGNLNAQRYGKQMQEVAELESQIPLTLTPREREVFTLLLTEAAPKQIAHELKISNGTYNYHSANLYRKLGINSRTELITRYSR